ncbi:lysine--tRNA ligase [Candidatus Shapirobacteria bacterium]|nr:MAG: lysine--tRNA ligase [Candidatus Shapirobacteria bacterium]
MSQTKLQQIRQQRLNKIDKLKSLGIDSYPQPKLVDKQTCQYALSIPKKLVLLAGRLMSIRGHGKILFADLVDQTGKIQLFFQQEELGKDQLKLAKILDIGDIVQIKGSVFKTSAGQITINVQSFKLLSKSIRPLPEKWHGFKDIEERYRQRYLDLIVNPQVRQVFQTRTTILTELRKYLDQHGFMEVETPILQPIYGGASAKPFVTHHNQLDTDMYLRISDELYLKRLIVGGFEKVYEVSRDFRNEGVSKFHNPEFTQIEFYWAYADYEMLMEFTEQMLTHIIKLVKGKLKISYQGIELDFTPPFKRLTFRDAIFNQIGIDVDLIENETQFKQALKDKNIKLDLGDSIGLGAYFDTLYKEFVRPHIVQPTYITDYPAQMIALAKKKEDDKTKIASFQLLANGTEVLKAYNELNDPIDQSARWKEEETLAKKGDETAMQFDDDYIRALEYGMPPTAGWGMGIDRLTQILTDQPTIKDVILFPTMRPKQAKIVNKINKVVVGKILSIKKHQQVDSLLITQVEVADNQKLQIITGASNIKVGQLVAVVLDGGYVFSSEGDLRKIKVGKLRGVKSEAMMCSAMELGIGIDHQDIHILPSRLGNHIGQLVNNYLI